MDYYYYSQNDIDKGVDYMTTNDLINYCHQYQFTENDNLHQQIRCLDEFRLVDDIEKDIDIKFDIEILIRTGSGYGLGCYLYQLINYIKNNSNYN